MSRRVSELIPRTSQDLVPNSQAQTQGRKEQRTSCQRGPFSIVSASSACPHLLRNQGHSFRQMSPRETGTPEFLRDY